MGGQWQEIQRRLLKNDDFRKMYLKEHDLPDMADWWYRMREDNRGRKKQEETKDGKTDS